MTQRNIDTMDIIVGMLADGRKISRALYYVYTKRNLAIPFNEDILDVHISKLGITQRAINTLLRGHISTLRDIINYCSEQKITNIKHLGRASGIEIFERILDYCWDNMDNDTRTRFLIDTVERNSQHLKPGLL